VLSWAGEWEWTVVLKEIFSWQQVAQEVSLLLAAAGELEVLTEAPVPDTKVELEAPVLVEVSGQEAVEQPVLSEITYHLPYIRKQFPLVPA